MLVEWYCAIKSDSKNFYMWRNWDFAAGDIDTFEGRESDSALSGADDDGFSLVDYCFTCWLLLHSLITANVSLELAASSASSTYTKRMWAYFDCSAFREDLRESTLLTSNHADSSEFYLCYDETLRRLLDKHAPSHKMYGEVESYHCGSMLSAVWPKSKLDDWRRSIA